MSVIGPIALTMAEIEGLQQWMWSTAPEQVGRLTLPASSAGPIGYTLRVPRTISISLGDNTILRFQFGLNMNPDFSGFSVTKSAQVWIVPRSPKETSDYSRDIIHRLREFMSFVADTDLIIRKARCWRQDFNQLSGGEEKSEAYANSTDLYPPIEDKERKLKSRDFFFEFERYQGRFADIINNWMRIYDENEFAMQWWFSNIVEERSIKYRETKFINAVISVESLCMSNYRARDIQARIQPNKYEGIKNTDSSPALGKLLFAEMKSLGHFDNEDYSRQLASKIVKFRAKIVHQDGPNPFLRYANRSEFGHLLWTVYCLFKLMILDKLGFDYDERAEIISRTQNLNGRLRLPNLDKLEERTQK